MFKSNNFKKKKKNYIILLLDTQTSHAIPIKAVQPAIYLSEFQMRGFSSSLRTRLAAGSGQVANSSYSIPTRIPRHKARELMESVFYENLFTISIKGHKFLLLYI